MKSIKIFFLVIFLTANLYSQNWNNIINTQLSVQQALSADVFLNMYGEMYYTMDIMDKLEFFMFYYLQPV